MRSLVFLLVSALLHGVMLAWLLGAFPSLRRKKKLLFGIFAAVILLLPVSRIVLSRIDGSWAKVVSAIAMSELVLVLLSLVPLAFVQLVGRLAFGKRRASTEASKATAPESEVAQATSSAAPSELPPHDASRIPQALVEGLSRREAFERVAGLAIVGASSTAIGWGVVRGRLDFSIEEVVVRVPGLPRALEGYTIAQVSDIHVGMFVQEAELARGLSLVARAKPDLVVATGDLVDFDPHYIKLMARSLGDLSARDGVAAVLGNHDYYTNGPEVRRELMRAGVRALVNEHVVLRPGDGGGIVLAGLDDYASARYGGRGPDLDRALAGAPDVPRVALVHQPQYFEKARGKVALQLSGHVHGGQINPVIRPAAYVLKYVAGLYEGEGSSLWVNRGFGTAGPPARIGAPPEITRIVLVAG